MRFGTKIKHFGKFGMIKEFNNFFKGKRVLITGHTGFIGSWLAIWLMELGANVIGYALPPYTKNDNFVVTDLKNKLESVYDDIRNYDKLSKVFKNYNPELVFHLAAQPLVRRSYKIPMETFDINIRGTLNIFEAFRKTNDSKILINFTSDKCYENQHWVWGYRENDKLGGHDPYSSSKACSELITSSYRNSFFNVNSFYKEKIISSVRSGNVIGGGDWQEDRLVPDCIKALKKKEDIIIRNPQSIRPWQYVLEPIRGMLTLCMKMWEDGNIFSGAWNFGPNNNSIISVEDLIKKIINYLEFGNYRTLPVRSNVELHETEVLLLDSSKSFRNLGWVSDLAIDKTIEYLSNWYFNDDVNYDFDVNQIKEFLKNINFKENGLKK